MTLEEIAALDLPRRIPGVPLHRRFAERVAREFKSVETRTWPWPYPPGWMVVIATKALGAMPVDPPGVAIADEACPASALTCIAWVESCLPLTARDLAGACLGEEALRRPLFGWRLGRVVRFGTPMPLEYIGWNRAPQKLAFVPRGAIEEALIG